MIAAVTLVASLIAQAVAAPAPVTTEEAKEGFVALFDGKSLNGWMTIPLGENVGSWVARDGVLTYTPGDSWIATAKTYTNFVLRLEYRTGTDSDSGIFMRSSEKGYPSFTGMEIEIRNDASGEPGPRSNTSIYGAAAPRKNVSKADGAWNVVEISLIKRRLVATLNGETIHDLDLDDPAYAGALRGPLSRRAKSGRIGFQAHVPGVPVEFRNVRIKVVP